MHVFAATAVVSNLARGQRGVVARPQLLAAGVSSSLITRFIRSGFLHPLHRGVYAVGHLALAELAKEQAALLACGRRALISGRSALYLWGIVQVAPADVEVTVVGHHRRKRQGIRLHLVEAIDDRDVRRRHGLPVTSPARTLIDFAAAARPQELEDAVAEARVKRLIRNGELEKTLARLGRIGGAGRMRAFLREEGGPNITRSRAERCFRRLLRDARLPQPKANAKVERYEVDFLWEAERVVLEVDGWRFHGHRRAFERDRRKDMVLADAGHHVIRITWRQFTEEALALIAHIARTLDRRSRTRG